MDKINALSRLDKLIYARGTNAAGIEVNGQFDSSTGERVRGDMDVTPDEILFRAWAQTQLPKYSEAALRKMWKER